MSIFNQKEIIGCLTGRFHLRSKGSPVLSGHGTVVVRQQLYRNQETGLNDSWYFATLYGDFKPDPGNLLFRVQKEAHFDTGGTRYQIIFEKLDKELEAIGIGFLCESTDDTIWRVEFDGKVDYLVKNRFGRKGRIYAMGAMLEQGKTE